MYTLRMAVFALVCFLTSIHALAQDERTLRIGITQYPANLHPNIESMVAKSYVLGFTQRQLTAYNANWDLVCLACTELPTLENGLAVLERTPEDKEGIALTFEIHADARWGDGVPVTTRDLEFAVELGKNPLSGTTATEMYRQIYQIDIHGDKRFTIHRDRRTFNYNAVNALNLLPEHLERSVFEKEPREYKNRTLYDSDSTNPGLYYGPYRVTEVVRGSYK